MFWLLRFVYRHRRPLLFLGTVAAVLALVGALSSVAFKPVPMCRYQGVAVAHATARAHPTWSVLRIWESVHSCARARVL